MKRVGSAIFAYMVLSIQKDLSSPSLQYIDGFWLSSYLVQHAVVTQTLAASLFLFTQQQLCTAYNMQVSFGGGIRKEKRSLHKMVL